MLLGKSKEPAKKSTQQKSEPKRQAHPMEVVRWPHERRPEGLGVSVKDGFNFGFGFGVAITIALPLLLAPIACILWVVVSVLGMSL